ncbi:gp53-like domain-containing protein [Megasphaera elsdenii]|uniref:gp53-like domain-containing protein n=1 Tax=Megasphaera elsdenii TaxID=907 RepID=UPI003B82F3F4
MVVCRQWGIVTCGTSSAHAGAIATATFPLAFSSGCYVISSNLVDGKAQNENWDGVTTWADNVTLTTMRIIATARFAMYGPLVSYIAIGA